MKKQGVRLIALTAVLLIQAGAADVMAQYDRDDFSRWSVSLFGGYTFPESNQGLQVIGTSFNVLTESSYHFGGGVQYEITPLWSLEGGYRYNTISGQGFDTVIHTASARNMFNLSRLYSRSSLADVINPFLILGVEQDFFTVETQTQTIERNESSLIGGMGLGFRVTNRIDLFGKYEFKLASNRLDNVDQGFPYDQIGMASGGIRIRFGGREARPLRSSSPTRRLNDSEYHDFVETRHRMEQNETLIAEQQREIEQLENTVQQREEEYAAYLDRLADRIAALESEVDSLEGQYAEMADHQYGEEDLRDTIEAGHYVQVFAARTYDSARNVRRMFQDLLHQEMGAGEEVFVIRRNGFYEVLIGSFFRVGNAGQILGSAETHFSDSFVITFPRPVHLEEEYRGTEIIWNGERLAEQ